MKIRSTHLIVLFLGALGVVALVALASGRQRPAVRDDDFLATVREQAGAGGGSSQAGTLPGQGQQNARVPVLVPETTDYDMGVIPNYEVTTRDIMLHNRGTAQLELTDIRTTCGCTVGAVDTRFIPAGGSIPMHVAVSPFKIPAFYSKKTLTIYSNDPANPMVTVDVTAMVNPEFEIDPPEISFGQVVREEGGQTVVTIRQLDDLEKPLEISGVQVLPPQAGIEAMLQPLPEEEWRQPGKPEYRIALAVLPTAPVGPIAASLSFRHNVARIPEMRMAIGGEVIGFYRTAIHLEQGTTLEPGGTAGGAYEIVAGDPVEVLGIETDVAGLSAGMRQGETPGQVFFDVHVAPEAEPGLYRGVLTVAFRSGGNEATERFPLQVAVRRTQSAPPEVRILGDAPGQVAPREQ